MLKTDYHRQQTAKLASLLDPKDIYDWLMETGFYPENYVLPPCFVVERFPKFGTQFFTHSPNKTEKYYVPTENLAKIQFPKTNLADRVFSVIDPKIHCQIAYEIAENWELLNSIFFDEENIVSSYSFPIPIDAKNPGAVGKLRSGRMIYEFIEMAENDLTAEAYQFVILVKADIKNFYHSIYTHTIAWAIHGDPIRQQRNRRNYSYLGNRLDKLFQNANDGRTNGVAIGPAVSDVISELILSRVDKVLSDSLVTGEYLAVRFKDDYRILCKNEESAKKIIKKIQDALRAYDLELNEDKTLISRMPDGLFRPWVSKYYAANPSPKDNYTYNRLKEVFLSVLATDREFPGTGIVDRFLNDLITKEYKPNFEVSRKTIPNTISLLLMLASLRIKSFPKVLGIIEAILIAADNNWYSEKIGTYLGDYLGVLATCEFENRYLIMWIMYFLKSNGLEEHIKRLDGYTDCFIQSVANNRNQLFSEHKDFQIFTDINAVSKKKSLLQHLEVFSPQ